MKNSIANGLVPRTDLHSDLVDWQVHQRIRLIDAVRLFVQYRTRRGLTRRRFASRRPSLRSNACQLHKRTQSLNC